MYIDRGFRDTIVLIPGWASDYRIFSTLNLGFNYLLPTEFSPSAFEKDLLNMLGEVKIEKVSLLGWSLGGFVAKDFFLKHPGSIDRLILVSIRRRYERAEIAKVSDSLRKNKKAYLYKFYNDCFSKKEDMRWFRQNLLKVYCDEFDLDYLLETLEYLGAAETKPQLLRAADNITIIHGEEDRIAPIKEVEDMRKELPLARFIFIKETGHIPFLNRDLDALYDR